MCNLEKWLGKRSVFNSSLLLCRCQGGLLVESALYPNGEGELHTRQPCSTSVPWVSNTSLTLSSVPLVWLVCLNLIKIGPSALRAVVLIEWA